MRKWFEIGGLVAAAVLIAFGVVAIAMGINGRNTVSSELKQQQIVGTPDMTPSGIKSEAQKAGLKNVTFPTCSVANEPVTSGARARCFAQYMRIHTLEATGGYTYAEMGRYQALPNTPKAQLATGGGTNNDQWAVKANGQPVDNGIRNLWVTETALTTALNTSYMADRLSLFGLVVGVALLLAGIGFGVLALGGTLRNAEPALNPFGRTKTETGAAAPTV